MPVAPIPEGFHTVTPYLVVRDVPSLLDFLAAAFDAEIIERTTLPDGRVMHAQVRIGDSMVMMGQAMDEAQVRNTMLYLYVPDADDWYRRALAAGATSIQEPKDEFYGDRNAGVQDPSGTCWWVATHIEDVPPDELARRAAAARG